MPRVDEAEMIETMGCARMGSCLGVCINTEWGMGNGEIENGWSSRCCDVGIRWRARSRDQANREGKRSWSQG